jgi:hypothetical protein
MNEVKIKKNELLDVVRKNRENHNTLFLRAQEGFRTRVVEELDRRLADARQGVKVNIAINLPEPQDHTEDYDRVIRMLEMSVDDEVVLQSHEFDQYVMDNWQWAKMVRTLNASYVQH